MADLKVNPELQIKRLQYKKAQHQLQLQGYDVRKTEIEDEIKRIKESENALRNAIEQADRDIKKLEQQLGK